MLTETFNDAACSSEDILFLDIVCRFDVGFRPESFLDIITVQFSVFLLTSDSYVVMQAVPWVVSSAVAVCQLPPLVQVASCVLQHYYRPGRRKTCVEVALLQLTYLFQSKDGYISI